MPLLSTLASASARGFGQGLAVEKDQSETLTGVASTASLGSVNVLAGTLISVSGISAAGAVGSANATGGSEAIPVSGVAGTATVGSASASLSVSAAVQGQGLTASIGVAQSAITKTDLIYDVSGVGATASVGSSTVNIPVTGVTVNLTGVSATASSGSASAVIPPSAQYFVGYYKFQESPTSSTRYGVNAVCYKWDGANVTLVGGSTADGYVSTTSDYTLTTAPPLAATNAPDAYGKYSVYFVSHGKYSVSLNPTVIGIDLLKVQFSASNGSSLGVSVAASVIVEASDGFGRAVSVGYNNTRVGFVVRHTGASGAKVRLYTINPANNGALTEFNFVTPPPVDELYNAIAVHPTDDFVVFGSTDLTTTLFAYKNIGRTSSPIEENTIYTQAQIGTPQFSLSQLKWSYSGNYLAIGADQTVVIVPYNSSTKELSVGSKVVISLSTDFDITKLEWGPGDAYLLVSGDTGTSNALATIQQSGGSWVLNAYQYPNSYANRVTALNYDGSYLFNLVTDAPSNLNIRVFSMESGNTGIPTSTVWTSNSLGANTTRDFYGAVALPPVQT